MSDDSHPRFTAEEDDSSIFYIERARLENAKNAVIEKAKEVLVEAQTKSSPPPTLPR